MFCRERKEWKKEKRGESRSVRNPEV